jgi:ribosomal protein L9
VEESRRVQELQRRLSRLDLTIKRHVNDDEQMYGSVTAKNISEKLAKSNLTVAEKDVLLEAPIKV